MFHVKHFGKDDCATNAHRHVDLPASGACIAKPVDDRIAPVAAKVFFRHFHAWSRLAPLIFGEIKKPLDLLHGFGIVTQGHDIGNAHFFFDEPFENRIEHLIGRQRI